MDIYCNADHSWLHENMTVPILYCFEICNIWFQSVDEQVPYKTCRICCEIVTFVVFVLFYSCRLNIYHLSLHLHFINLVFSQTKKEKVVEASQDCCPVILSIDKFMMQPKKAEDKQQQDDSSSNKVAVFYID